MAERYGDELAEALPEVDAVAGFGVPVTLGPQAGVAGAPSFDLLNLPRPRPPAPWAYVKVAEGCDRACGFCAIPSFRGPQRSRTVESTSSPRSTRSAAAEIVLVAQDLAAFGRDQGAGRRRSCPLVEAVAARVDRVRLLYLYPSDLTDGLIDADLRHRRAVLRPVAAARVAAAAAAHAALGRRRPVPATASPTSAPRSPRPRSARTSSSATPARPRPTTTSCCASSRRPQLDWCGFFAYSPEDGTYAAGLDGAVTAALVAERLAELRELQDAITAGDVTLWSARGSKCSWTSPASAAPTARRRRSTASSRVPDDLAVGTIVHRHGSPAPSGVDLEAA